MDIVSEMGFELRVHDTIDAKFYFLSGTQEIHEGCGQEPKRRDSPLQSIPSCKQPVGPFVSLLNDSCTHEVRWRDPLLVLEARGLLGRRRRLSVS